MNLGNDIFQLISALLVTWFGWWLNNHDNNHKKH